MTEITDGVYADTEITTKDWHDYCYQQQLITNGESDVYYKIAKNPEPDDPSNLYFVEVYDWVSGEMLSAHTSEDPYAEVQAYREVQACPDIEERWNREAEREHRERMGY